MDSMYCGDVLEVDLEAGSTEQVAFEELDEAGPGLASGLALFEKHSDGDPLVFGAGLFTGTAVPGACLGFVLGRSPVTGGPAVSPLNMFAGVEMKLSGFAAVVVKGASPAPAFLWLHDGVADLLDASAFWGKDTWETTDGIRREMGEGLVQVVSTGPAGESCSGLASYSINYWGSGDTAGLGALMGEKKLKAVALRGLGMIDADDPGEFYSRGLELYRRCRPSRGFRVVCERLGEADLDSWLEPLAHRHRACFACPRACSTYVKYNEEPSVMAADGVEEPGTMVASAAAALWLRGGGWTAEAACRSMEQMARAGVDQVRGARELAGGPPPDAAGAAAAVRGLEGAAEARWPSGQDGPAGLFGRWVPPIAGEAEWLAANRLGYVLGICPTFLLTSGLEHDDLLDLCVPAAGVELDRACLEALG